MIDKTKTLFRIVLIVAGTCCSGMANSESPEKGETASEEKPPAWYVENWPQTGSLGKFRKMKNGRHTWRNAKGDVVGEVEVKDGHPVQGIAYIQGAADYRYVTQYEEGKSSMLVSFLFKEGRWVVFQTNLRGEQGDADQPAAAPESRPDVNQKPKPETEDRSQ